MNESAPPERQKRLLFASLGKGIAVDPVLLDGVLNRLGHLALQLCGGYGKAVEEKDEIQRQMSIIDGMMHLPDDPQNIAAVPAADLRIQQGRRAKLGQSETGAQPLHLYRMAQPVKRALVVQVLTDLGSGGLGGFLDTAVLFEQGFPLNGPRRLQPLAQISRIKEMLPVKPAVVRGITPAVPLEGQAEFFFKMVFLVDIVHAVLTSIFPVTASLMRAVRRCLRS